MVFVIRSTAAKNDNKQCGDPDTRKYESKGYARNFHIDISFKS